MPHLNIIQHNLLIQNRQLFYLYRNLWRDVEFVRPWYLNSDGSGRRFENPTAWHKSNIKIEEKMDEKEGNTVNGRVRFNNKSGREK